MHYAVEEGNVETVKLLLERPEIQVNAQSILNLISYSFNQKLNNYISNKLFITFLNIFFMQFQLVILSNSQ